MSRRYRVTLRGKDREVLYERVHYGNIRKAAISRAETAYMGTRQYWKDRNEGRDVVDRVARFVPRDER